MGLIVSWSMFTRAIMKARESVRWSCKFASDNIRWLLSPFPVRIFVLAVIFLVVIWYGPICQERQIRWSGMVFQLFGVLNVFFGLRDTWESIKQWWRARPEFRPKKTVLQAKLISLGTLTASARGRLNAAPNASAQQRLALLEQKHADLSDFVFGARLNRGRPT